VVVSVPAETMVKAFHPQFIAWTIFAAAVLFAVSRGFFRLARRAYRSASSGVASAPPIPFPAARDPSPRPLSLDPQNLMPGKASHLHGHHIAYKFGPS
jgi:hypothetical protein